MAAFMNQPDEYIEYVKQATPLDGVLEQSEAGEVGEVDSEKLSEYRRIIHQAALLVAVGQPDSASLLLDGLAQRLALAWFAGRGLAVPDLQHLLLRLEEQQSDLAWWLRLALRAPDIEARLSHCRRLLAVIDGH